MPYIHSNRFLDCKITHFCPNNKAFTDFLTADYTDFTEYSYLCPQNDTF